MTVSILPSETLGARVRETREARQISQARLADIVGLSRSYLCDIERGRAINPSLPTIKRIADGLQASVEHFLIDDTHEPECRHWYIQTNGAGVGRCADCGDAFTLEAQVPA